MPVIEQHIEHEYLLRERSSRWKTSLSVLTAAAAIYSAVLPDPLGRFLSIFCLVLSVPVLFALLWLNIKGLQQMDPAPALLAIGAVLGGATLLMVAILFGGIALVEPGSREFTVPASVLSMIGAGLLFFIGARRLNRIRQADVASTEPTTLQASGTGASSS
jgi:hypothetical protein